MDLNQDGNKDLIFFGFTSPTMSKTETPQESLFYWGTGFSNYALASATSISLPATSHPREIAYADFNKDGKLDIFLADHGWDTMPFPGGQNQLILSSPTGWISSTSFLPTRTDFTHCTAVGDINNDGNVDIFLGNVSTVSSQFNASILFGDGTGHFSESITAVPSEIRGPIRFYAAQIADLNRDGWVDLIIGNSGDANNSKSQSIIYWNKNGVFENSNSTLLPNGFFGAKNEQILDIQSADINGDGRKDLVLLSTQNNPYYDGWSIQILSNQGNAFVDITSEAFGSNVSSMGTPNQAKQMPWVPFLKLVDLNNDGNLDILFDSIKNYNSASPETQALFYLNDGFGHYTPIFANDILDLNATYKDFFANASSFVNNLGISWVSYFAYQDSIYFRELLPTKPLPKVSSITATTGADTVVGNELDNSLFGLAGN
ncbi:MAG: VCBS repeat-containing protein, partial [Candidatus Nanopelagicales bacterium]|nr:VCBS repeat-containing protein [Candidatus Nanopelagicales bacterium]